MSDSFYINLNLQELNALQKVSAMAWIAYVHFKRNIDFATGKGSQTYSIYALRSILSRPSRGQGCKAETVSIKGVQSIIAQLEAVGLLCYDRDTFSFELPKHDKTPEPKPQKPRAGKRRAGERSWSVEREKPTTPTERKETQPKANDPDAAQFTQIKDFAKRLKQEGFAYTDNPKSQPYYLNWQRLINSGRLKPVLFERVLVELLQTTQSTPTPRALDEAIRLALNNKDKRQAPGRGDLVL